MEFPKHWIAKKMPGAHDKVWLLFWQVTILVHSGFIIFSRRLLWLAVACQIKRLCFLSFTSCNCLTGIYSIKKICRLISERGATRGFVLAQKYIHRITSCSYKYSRIAACQIFIYLLSSYGKQNTCCLNYTVEIWQQKDQALLFSNFLTIFSSVCIFLLVNMDFMVLLPSTLEKAEPSVSPLFICQ